MSKIVVYTSPTCGPCRQLKPILVELTDSNRIALEIVDASDETKQQFADNGIRAVPTVVYIRNGREYARFVGAQTRTGMMKYLENWDLLISQ